MSVRFMSACPAGKLLDVGCGSGEWLCSMAQRGWDVEGTEVDPVAAEVARAKGLTVRVGKLESLNYADETFSAVSVYHVVEHVPMPLQLLRECWRILKPGGRLVVVTPNGRSLGRRIFGANWRGIEAPRHLHIFNVEALRGLMRDADFDAPMVRSVTVSRYMISESLTHAVPKSISLGIAPAITILVLELLCIALGFDVGEVVLGLATKTEKDQ